MSYNYKGAMVRDQKVYEDPYITLALKNWKIWYGSSDLHEAWLEAEREQRAIEEREILDNTVKEQVKNRKVKRL